MLRAVRCAESIYTQLPHVGSVCKPYFFEWSDTRTPTLNNPTHVHTVHQQNRVVRRDRHTHLHLSLQPCDPHTANCTMVPQLVYSQNLNTKSGQRRAAPGSAIDYVSSRPAQGATVATKDEAQEHRICACKWLRAGWEHHCQGAAGAWPKDGVCSDWPCSRPPRLAREAKDATPGSLPVPCGVLGVDPPPSASFLPS